ncbi:MAG: four helix bundle protein [Acidobacteria bacterium]|nr:MAG: four helix bundle protein [Acidobacteriota bacterium]
MSYKNSDIYKKAFELALRIEPVCRSFPRHEQYALAEQLRNASRSIGANYVEGYVRQNILPADHRRFLIYSQGSCDETRYWLDFGKAIGLIPAEKHQELVPFCNSLTRMLVPLIRGLS